jgi:hypothetical protein
MAPTNKEPRAGPGCKPDKGRDLSAVERTATLKERGREDGARYCSGRFRSRCRRDGPNARITEEKISAFVEAMRVNVLTGETPFRRAYIRSMVDQVEGDDAEIIHLLRPHLNLSRNSAGKPASTRERNRNITPSSARRHHFRVLCLEHRLHGIEGRSAQS